MRELKKLATLKKNLSHTWSLQPPVSLPPVWPPCSAHLATSASPHFHCISDRAVQSYFSSVGKSTNPSVRKGGQTGGRETGGCCDQVCERIFFEVAKFFILRMTYSDSIKLLPPKFVLIEKMTLKGEIPVF